MTLSNLKVVRVMSRCDLNNTCTKFHIDISIGYNRNFSVNDREQKLLADDIFISVIFGIYRYCSITQHGFGSCGCEFQETGSTDASVFFDHRILNVPEVACLLLIFYFRIGNGSITYRTPVDDTASLVNPTLFMHLAENFGYGLVTAFIHGKTFSVPVTGGTQFFQLADNTSAVLSLPVPGSLKESVSSKIFFADAFFLHLFDNLNFCRNTGMVCSRLP